MSRLDGRYYTVTTGEPATAQSVRRRSGAGSVEEPATMSVCDRLSCDIRALAEHAESAVPQTQNLGGSTTTYGDVSLDGVRGGLTSARQQRGA
jgi:hypothetical protein